MPTSVAAVLLQAPPYARSAALDPTAAPTVLARFVHLNVVCIVRAFACIQVSSCVRDCLCEQACVQTPFPLVGRGRAGALVVWASLRAPERARTRTHTNKHTRTHTQHTQGLLAALQDLIQACTLSHLPLGMI